MLSSTEVHVKYLILKTVVLLNIAFQVNTFQMNWISTSALQIFAKEFAIIKVFNHLTYKF